LSAKYPVLYDLQIGKYHQKICIFAAIDQSAPFFVVTALYDEKMVKKLLGRSNYYEHAIL
jgi:hypothetical protein